MNNFKDFITPEQAVEMGVLTDVFSGNKITMDEFRRRAALKDMCEVCGAEPVWRLVDTGMCFSCTTGEADASDDYELIQL